MIAVMIRILAMLLISHQAHAVIHGNDDRTDTIHASTLAQKLAKSSAALVQGKHFKPLPQGAFEMSGVNLAKYGLCSDQAFADEPSIATCSASFVGGNRILTAAHCLDEKEFSCEQYKIVFDYKRPSIPFSKTYTMNADQVYQCKKVIYTKFDIFSEDLAIIELDRNVVGREPIKVDPSYQLHKGESLMMIGHPLGISQKAVEDGEILSIDRKNVSFRHNLDTFSVNSGGPIFNMSGTQVGVLVRGTGPNFERIKGRECDAWGVGGDQDFSEGNDLSPLKKFFKN